MTGALAGAVDIVVVAAGSSTRMGGSDKLQAPLLDRPLLAWTLDAVRASTVARRIILVTAPDRLAALSQESWLQGTDVSVVPGGARRQASVAAGLAAATSELVLVHDGARPLVSPALVDRVAQATSDHGAAVPGWPVVESLKRVRDGRVLATVERGGLIAAQTPQGGHRRSLLDALTVLAETDVEVTDEAAALETTGQVVVVVEGEADNLKVTTPADLERAATILAARFGPSRIGQGHDSHPFGPGDGLALGGIRIDEAPALAGHSDGDVALHALADALQAATGGVDLGRRFPADDPATRGADSKRLLESIAADLATEGWQAVAVDVLIRGARPRLGAARLDTMRDVIAELLGLSPSVVSVHASTGNLDGPEGAGRSISASAIVQVVRR